jgi:hypothetical protein
MVVSYTLNITLSYFYFNLFFLMAVSPHYPYNPLSILKYKPIKSGCLSYLNTDLKINNIGYLPNFKSKSLSKF